MKKVLIIDDEKDIIFVLGRLLPRLDKKKVFDFLLTSDWQEGVRILEKEKIETVILDVGLPGISGINIARKAIKINGLIKIIFMHGGIEINPDFQCEQIIKPVLGLDLIQKLYDLEGCP